MKLLSFIRSHIAAHEIPDVLMMSATTNKTLILLHNNVTVLSFFIRETNWVVLE